MRRRAIISCVLVGCLLAGGLLLWQWPVSPDEIGGKRRGGSAASAGPVAPQVTLMPVAAEAARLNSEDTEIEEDLQIVASSLSFYRRLFKENPVGLNHEIVGALAGRNAKGAAFLAPDHPAISAQGELLDGWGTAFFFHQLSAQEMEVISAGPDRKMWTADDMKSG